MSHHAHAETPSVIASGCVSPVCVYTHVCVFVVNKSWGHAVSTVTVSLGGPSLIAYLALMI